MDYLGGKYVSVCKACGKLGGVQGHAPLGNLILDFLLGGIWDCFHTNKFTTYCVIKGFMIELHVK